MHQLEVAGEPVNKVSVGAGTSHLAHSLQVHLALGVEDLSRGSARHQREDDFGKQLSRSATWELRGAQPCVELGEPCVGNGIELALCGTRLFKADARR